MYNVQDKVLNAALYREVTMALTRWSYEEHIQKDAELHKRVLEMRDSFLNARRCVEESLEAYAQASLPQEVAAAPVSSSLAEAIETHLGGGTPPGLETKRPARNVGPSRQLDEATLWGK